MKRLLYCPPESEVIRLRMQGILAVSGETENFTIDDDPLFKLLNEMSL